MWLLVAVLPIKYDNKNCTIFSDLLPRQIFVHYIIWHNDYSQLRSSQVRHVSFTDGRKLEGKWLLVA